MDSIYQQSLNIIKPYLGPVSERFLERQIRSHLNGEPSALKKEDMPELAHWVEISMGLVVDDKRIVEECVSKLLELSR